MALSISVIRNCANRNILLKKIFHLPSWKLPNCALSLSLTQIISMVAKRGAVWVWLNQRVEDARADINNDYYCCCRTLFLHLNVRECEFMVSIKQSPARFSCCCCHCCCYSCHHCCRFRCCCFCINCCCCCWW